MLAVIHGFHYFDCLRALLVHIVSRKVSATRLGVLSNILCSLVVIFQQKIQFGWNSYDLRAKVLSVDEAQLRL